MSRIINAVLLLLCILLVIYVYPPSPDFPSPPRDFVQSLEPADIETDFRRGYYTNLSRQEVINHYKNEFKNVFGVYTSELNYPPEEAKVLIRDQTKSSYLKELVHPFRESIYINGFEPKTEEYAQYYLGKKYSQKIIVRYVPSKTSTRVLLIIGSALAVLFLVREYRYAKK